MTLDLTDEEAALLLKELNGIIDGDRYFLSDRTRTLKATTGFGDAFKRAAALTPTGGSRKTGCAEERR
jgi:hypothetical protein